MQPRQVKVRPKAQGLGDRGLRRGQVSDRLQCAPQVMERNGIGGIDPNGAFEQVHGPGRLAVAHCREREHVQRLDIVGAAFEHGLAGPFRLGEATCLQQSFGLGQRCHARISVRQDILDDMAITDLRHYIRTYDGDLEPALCNRMLDSFHALGRYHTPERPRSPRRPRGLGVDRAQCHRACRTQAFLGFFRARIDRALDRYNRDVGLGIPVPNSPKTADLILKRYRPGANEKFQQHFDSVHEVANRYFVLLWYLNDVAEGGETVFPQLDVKVAARQGRLLVFPPYWMFQHAGLPPRVRRQVHSLDVSAVLASGVVAPAVEVRLQPGHHRARNAVA